MEPARDFVLAMGERLPEQVHSDGLVAFVVARYERYRPLLQWLAAILPDQ